MNGIAEKEGDYTNPELAREHVFRQQNWATGLGGSNELVLNINHPSDVNKCAENLFGLYNDYKDSGKHYAGIAVAEKFASAGYLVPSDTPPHMWQKPQNWGDVKKIIEGVFFKSLALTNLPETLVLIYGLVYLPLKDGVDNWPFKAAYDINQKYGLAFSKGFEDGTSNKQMHCAYKIASQTGTKLFRLPACQYARQPSGVQSALERVKEKRSIFRPNMS